MIARKASSSLVAAAAVFAAQDSHAQRVSADVHIGGWPVAGTVHIGDHPYGHYDVPPYGYYGRSRRPVIVEHRYPRIIVVEHRRHFRDFKHWRRANRVSVYYDRHCNKYFDRYHRGLEEIGAYSYDGRYYRFDDDRFDRYDRYDRYGRYDRDRYRDRRYGSYGRYERGRSADRRDRDWDDDDDDDRWEHDHR